MDCYRKRGNLSGKIIVAACNRILKRVVGIVQLLKFLCDGRKIDIKHNRDRNRLRRHDETIGAITIVGWSNTVDCNRINEIAKIGGNRNSYEVANGGAFHINGIVTAYSASTIKQIHVIGNFLVCNIYHYIRGGHREGILIFCNLCYLRVVYGNGVNLIARARCDGCSNRVADKNATGLKGYTSVQALAYACAICAK